VLKRLRKSVRRVIARPRLQQPYRMLYRFALAGMNYGGAGSYLSAGDELALERVAKHGKRPATIFDVGANVGSYTKQALQICGADTVVHAFEPSGAAFARLDAQFGKLPNVHLSKAGIGAAPGAATLYFDEPGSVLASTHGRGKHREEVKIITLDDYCAEHRIEHIDLLKLDLEGGELEALQGARRILDGIVDVVQFEFGEPSIGSRTYFADIFRLLADRYAIYRCLPKDLQRIERYDQTLEVFMSTNYLAIKSTG
jgi:FkbM family methyltransferase